MIVLTLKLRKSDLLRTQNDWRSCEDREEGRLKALLWKTYKSCKNKKGSDI